MEPMSLKILSPGYGAPMLQILHVHSEAETCPYKQGEKTALRFGENNSK